MGNEVCANSTWGHTGTHQPCDSAPACVCACVCACAGGGGGAESSPQLTPPANKLHSFAVAPWGTGSTWRTVSLAKYENHHQRSPTAPGTLRPHGSCPLGPQRPQLQDGAVQVCAPAGPLRLVSCGNQGPESSAEEGKVAGEILIPTAGRAGWGGAGWGPGAWRVSEPPRVREKSRLISRSSLCLPF